MKRRVISIGALVLSFVFPINSIEADSATPAFAAPDARQVPVGSWQYFFTPSHLLPLSYIATTGPNPSKPFSAVLAPCDGNQSACIEKVQYQVGEGSWNDASAGPDEGQRAIAFGTLNGANNWQMTYTSTFKEDLTIMRPEGNTARLWSFPNAPHAAGSTYQVSAKLGGDIQPNGSYTTNSFQLQVIPVTRVPGSPSTCNQPSIWEEKAQMSPDGYCTTKYDFPANIRIRVLLKLGPFLNALQGWFDGRLDQALIKVDSGKQTIQFEASPLIVPSASTSAIRYQDIPAGLPQAPTPEVIATQNRSNSGTAGFANVNNDFELQAFTKLGDLINEKAIGENTMWVVSSMSSPNDGRCLKPGILNGIVLTNATVYNAAAPLWSAQDSSLNFKVAATHFNTKGELFKGYYKLLLSEEVAKCYWGNDFARGTASISITNQDGTSGVATTNLGQRDGWVNFEAAGFTFSSPTIKAKILPYVAPAPSPSPSATPTQAPNKSVTKRSIKCISPSKKVKTFTGENPKCPKGYKLK